MFTTFLLNVKLKLILILLKGKFMSNSQSLLSSGLSLASPSRVQSEAIKSNRSKADSQQSVEIASTMKIRQDLAKDSMSVLNDFSLPTVVGAFIDHLNVSSPYTTATEPSVKGSAIVGVLLEGYAPNLSDKLGGYLDFVLKTGLVTEGDVAYLASKPEIVTNHIKPIMESIAKQRAHSS